MSNYPVLYYYDRNRRVYELNGVKNSSPYEIGYFVKIEIIDETQKEYISNYGFIKKKTMKYHWGRSKFDVYTEKEMNDHVFICENRHRISEIVRSLKDADLLKKVEELLTIKEAAR